MISATNLRKKNQTTKFPGTFLFLGLSQLLYIDGFLHLETLQDRGFGELLACTQLLHHTCFLEFSLEFLQRSFDVLAIFYGYNNPAFVLNF